MLRSNWSIGDVKLYRPHVIRQKIGRAAAKPSAQPHKFLSTHQRETLCAILEHKAAKRAARKA